MDMTEGLEEARSIAWQLAATPGSAAGPALPPDSYGHSGFTGTSCWIDPQNGFSCCDQRHTLARYPSPHQYVRRSFIFWRGWLEAVDSSMAVAGSVTQNLSLALNADLGCLSTVHCPLPTVHCPLSLFTAALACHFLRIDWHTCKTNPTATGLQP